jgi:hypothetical protein
MQYNQLNIRWHTSLQHGNQSLVFFRFCYSHTLGVYRPYPPSLLLVCCAITFDGRRRPLATTTAAAAAMVAPAVTPPPPPLTTTTAGTGTIQMWPGSMGSTSSSLSHLPCWSTLSHMVFLCRRSTRPLRRP